MLRLDTATVQVFKCHVEERLVSCWCIVLPTQRQQQLYPLTTTSALVSHSVPRLQPCCTEGLDSTNDSARYTVQQ